MNPIDLTGKLYPEKFYDNHSVDGKGNVHEDNWMKWVGRKIVKQTVDPEVIKLFEAKSEELLQLSRQYLSQHVTLLGDEPQTSENEEALRKKINFFIYNASVFQKLSKSDADLHLQELNTIREILKLSEDVRMIVRVNCGDEGVLQLNSDQLKEIPLFKSMFEDLDGSKEVQVLNIPLPEKINKNQLEKAYWFAAKKEILETDARALLQDYLASSFLGFEEYENALHEKILTLSPLIFAELAEDDFGLFDRSINESFKERMDYNERLKFLDRMQNEIDRESVPASKMRLSQLFIVYDKAFRVSTFDNLNQFFDSMKNVQEESKRMIKFIDLSHLQISDQEFAEVIEILKEFPNLEQVKFKPKTFRDEHLEQLSQLKSLKRLDLTNCYSITDAGLAYISEMSQLTHLNLSDCYNFTDASLSLLSEMTQLTHLSLLSIDKVTDAGLAHLSGMTLMTHLDLSFLRRITDAGLAHLSRMTQMTQLNLYGLGNTLGHVTDEGLAHLSGMTQMSHLNLAGLNLVTDAGLAHLSGMTQMTHLDLSWMRLVSDFGLAHLSGMTQMEDLNLSWLSNITDAGLEHFKKMPLRRLNILNTSISMNALRKYPVLWKALVR